MIGVVGLNHTTAPVEIRERLSMREEETGAYIGELREESPAAELVVLSTCNRTEVYFSLPKDSPFRDTGHILRTLTRFHALEAVENAWFYSHSRRRAVVHLFRVASGLDSLVLGENEILGQVKNAYRISASRGHTGAFLNRLFHMAFRVGKRVRTETGINQGSSSVGYAAMALAQRAFGKLADLDVLLVGAGETAELVLKSFQERGGRRALIANRTRSRAERLAACYGAEVADLGRLDDHLSRCDLVVTSTSAPQPLIREDQVRPCMARRGGRRLVFVDLSVPRDVEEAVAAIPGVLVHDIDDLEQVAAENRRRRKKEIGEAEKIIDEVAREYFEWVRSLRLGPTISLLSRRFDDLTEPQVAAVARNVSAESAAVMNELAERLKKRYFGEVVKNLRRLTGDGTHTEYLDMVRRLFDLPEEDE